MSGTVSDNGWREAAVAWEVCASLHRQYCKGKDALFTTRQSDFVKHAENARVRANSGQAPATQQAGDVVAYLDVGAGGYLDLGSELSEDALQQLPKGRHALVIAGTYGIDGYVAAPQPSPTAKAAPQQDATVAAFEAVRKKLCTLPRYSFVLDDDGLVRRAPDRTGNWIEFDEAHTLFDPVSVDAAIAAQGGKT